MFRLPHLAKAVVAIPVRSSNIRANKGTVQNSQIIFLQVLDTGREQTMATAGTCSEMAPVRIPYKGIY